MAQRRPSDPAYAETLAPTMDGREGRDAASAPAPPPAEPSVSVAETAPRAARFPVDSWDRYQFLSLLGQGGMGAVYRARDLRLGRTVALKFIRIGDEQLSLRFLQEARAQARIDHPSVCKVYEVGEVEGKPYIAMQFIAGASLAQARSRLTLLDKVQLVRDAALALHAAHSLGIVHRDIKPANVMVEQQEDGRLRPVVMDFGLARDSTAAEPLTKAGVVMGTPGYMAPEQAAGDRGQVDRRSDVYSLGAMLYDLLAGRPPFDGESTLQLLMKVIDAEPVPLRQLLPSTPVDLETAVMTCLRKEPHRRYESARAFAEDLGRYLNDEPILARPQSSMSRLLRRARKHRALVSTSAVAALSLLLLGGFWLRSRIQQAALAAAATQRAQQAQQLGQVVKELELFLRVAHALPLHDMQAERQVMARRMAELKEQLARQPAREGAPWLYALGRGHLALREYDPARRLLAQALAAQEPGPPRPELHYALGRVLGEQYRRELEVAQRSGDKRWLARRERELERSHLEPALQHLRQAGSLDIESPEYASGLLALYHRDYEAAERAAAAAAAKAPWLAEAFLLRADVPARRGREAQQRGDFARARADYEQAAALYQQAAERARSDETIHEAEATVWRQAAELAEDTGGDVAAAVQRGLLACERAHIVHPGRSEPLLLRAALLALLARDAEGHGRDGSRETAQAVAAVAEALRRGTADPSAYITLGNLQLGSAYHEERNGRSPQAALAQALRTFETLRQRQPGWTLAWHLVGAAHMRQAYYLSRQHRDPGDELNAAVAHFEKAIELDDSYEAPYRNIGLAYEQRIRFGLSRGEDPEPLLGKLAQFGAQALRKNPSRWLVHQLLGDMEQMRARYLTEKERDVQPALTAALGHYRDALRINAAAVSVHAAIAEVHAALALVSLIRGSDPGESVRSGLAAAGEALRLDPRNADVYLLQARFHRLAARWLDHESQRPDPPLLQAIAATRRALAIRPDFADAHQTLAEMHQFLAYSHAEHRQLAEPDTEAGLAAIEQALRLAPDGIEARAVQGALFLTRAYDRQNHGDLAGQRQWARRAVAALEEALRKNPLLFRRFSWNLGSARKMAGLAER